ncbi:hypothetical protein [Paracoccus fistulariae]|uniref:Uncharacterized protein n=1 Tax=Paracoccus fistulariae TaxID=658446 RepID=A0ABY7SMB8_9RHOB|nr:hypothetical protein [Paracoccus fistulariae]MDB6179937.1 hypothetical protein [Paracoccus fistulariae]WCR08034.1 hypothetical protein JHX87_04205 [Paracoccus fistulariae]
MVPHLLGPVDGVGDKQMTACRARICRVSPDARQVLSGRDKFDALWQPDFQQPFINLLDLHQQLAFADLSAHLK